jgi:DNA-binding IclR family transcriptional regulator
MREAIVAYLSPGLESKLRTADGLNPPLGTQVAELTLTAEDRKLHVDLVVPGPSTSAAAPEAVAAELRQLRPNHLVVVQQSSAPGVAAVAAPTPVDDFDSFLVAAGVAVIQYAWGWEESPAVVVTVNGTAFTITARHREGKTYIAKQVDAA